MFRRSSEQTSLLEPLFSLSPAKQQRLAATWAGYFRERCLPLIDEQAFASCYCADNGRPNASIRVVVGLLILQEVFAYTDAEILEAAEFDLRFQTALGLTSEAPIPCQKTLHNFRVRLAQDDRVELLFQTTTDQLIAQLNLQTDRQRLDSTQICSNIQLLSRLSRFCETHRLLLHRLTRYAPAELARVSAAVQRRYVREDGTDSSYDQARAQEGRRRLAVCARDTWRLVDAFRGIALPEPVAAVYALVQRLLREQCVEVPAPATPAADDADVQEPPVPIRLREKGEVAAGGLQTPHDPDATYGHKGTGYTVVVCETVGNGATPELLTHLAVTTSSASDQLQTQPTVTVLQDREIQPQALLVDASFASTENLLACQAKGTTLIGPVTGGAGSPTDAPQILVSCQPGASPSACSVGVLAESTERYTTNEQGRYQVIFTAEACAECPQAAQCPAKCLADGRRSYRVSELDAVNQYRRYIEATDAYKDEYRWRSGIEGTNSELKRAHAMAKLRVRGRNAVRVAVFLKGLACNIKRVLKYWQRQTAPTAPLVSEMPAHSRFCVRVYLSQWIGLIWLWSDLGMTYH